MAIGSWPTWTRPSVNVPVSSTPMRMARTSTTPVALNVWSPNVAVAVSVSSPTQGTVPVYTVEADPVVPVERVPGKASASAQAAVKLTATESAVYSAPVSSTMSTRTVVPTPSAIGDCPTAMTFWMKLPFAWSSTPIRRVVVVTGSVGSVGSVGVSPPESAVPDNVSSLPQATRPRLKMASASARTQTENCVFMKTPDAVHVRNRRTPETLGEQVNGARQAKQ